jgi:dihydroneopterin aldolase
MAIIALEGMQFHAFHGYYEEERLLGNNFVLDVFVTTDISKAAISDELYIEHPQKEPSSTTINYETIYRLCKVEMAQPTKLLETLVHRILARIYNYFDNVEGVMVRLKKLNPPLGGRVDSSWLMVSTEGFDSSFMELL